VRFFKVEKIMRPVGVGSINGVSRPIRNP